MCPPARSETEFKPGDLGHSTDGPDVDVGRHTRRTLASFSMTGKVGCSFRPVALQRLQTRAVPTAGREARFSSSLSRGWKKPVSSARSLWAVWGPPAFMSDKPLQTSVFLTDAYTMPAGLCRHRCWSWSTSPAKFLHPFPPVPRFFMRSSLGTDFTFFLSFLRAGLNPLRQTAQELT